MDHCQVAVLITETLLYIRLCYTQACYYLKGEQLKSDFISDFSL